MLEGKTSSNEFKRWEMGQLNTNSQAAKEATPAPKKTPLSPELTLVLESLRKQAFEKGMQEGYAAGMEKARVSQEILEEKILGIALSFQESLKTADQTMAQDILDLALDVAKAMLKTSLNADPTQMLPLVQHCIHYLPYVERPALLILHPEDAVIVRQHLKEDLLENHWQVVEDSKVERGGCMVETASNEIDATNATRWKRIMEALGRTNDWQEGQIAAGDPSYVSEKNSATKPLKDTE